MTRRIVTSPQDPRALTLEPHRISRQTHGARRWIHGPIAPMAPEPPSWRLIAAAAVVALVIVPGFLWWCGSF